METDADATNHPASSSHQHSPQHHVVNAHRPGARGIALPAPFAPSSSLVAYKARLRAAFAGAPPRVCVAFWLFGLINNVLYVIILSAALDLVGPSLPKSIVLLFDVVPSLITKLTFPYVSHLLPYHPRVAVLIVLSFTGMQLVAWSAALPTRLFGVALASVSSGLGELSFLGMTHYYGAFALPFWGSGTGMAGLAGAGMYSLATTGLGWGVRASLMVFGCLPAVMAAAFWGVLPMAPLKGKGRGYEPLAEDAPPTPTTEAEEGLLGEHGRREFPARDAAAADLGSFRAKLRRSAALFVPYMLPLLLVYSAEYLLNLGVLPTVLFPLDATPFHAYRDFYPLYSTLYQAGVFVSRSSTPFVRVPHLYTMSLLQCGNLALLVSHALWDWIPSVWIVFAVVFWEGLLGGGVYVNTFAQITEEMRGEAREFALSATTVADSAGICLAGFMGLWVEGALCGWQVRHGRELCTMA